MIRAWIDLRGRCTDWAFYRSQVIRTATCVLADSSRSCLFRADTSTTTVWYVRAMRGISSATVGRVLTHGHGDDACRHRPTAIQTARSVPDPKTSLAALRPQSVPAQRPGLHRSALPHSPPCSDNNAASDSCSKRIAQSSGWDPFFAWALMLAPWSIRILTIF